jgi:hypothetical protein
MAENENVDPTAAFESIVAGVDLKLEYQPLEVSENAPEAIAPNRKNRQWALVDPNGLIVALGPATGGGKSAFIKHAAENPGFKVAHRWVESGGWLVPKD